MNKITINSMRRPGRSDKIYNRSRISNGIPFVAFARVSPARKRDKVNEFRNLSSPGALQFSLTSVAAPSEATHFHPSLVISVTKTCSKKHFTFISPRRVSPPLREISKYIDATERFTDGRFRKCSKSWRR